MPQFDVVFNELTVEEHLRLYARIKGVDQKHLVATVRQIAERVGLDGDAFGMAAVSLSGGQKRRLSLAMALLGDPKVLLLDEPTTGTDPETRRSMWGIVTRERVESRRTTIITTHDMSEADALSTRIAIMSHGRMRAIGNAIQLKRQWGEGYKLTATLTADTPQALDTAHQYVCRVAAGSRLASHVGTTVVWMVPRDAADVADLFERLTRDHTTVCLQEFGLSVSSLEEVFVAVIEAAERERVADASEFVMTNPALQAPSRSPAAAAGAGAGAGAGSGSGSAAQT